MIGFHTAFDQRNELIGLATDRGFIIFDCTMKIVIYEAVFPVGGSNCISLLSDSNLVAISGDDTPNGFSKKTIVLWDTSGNQAVRKFNVQAPVESLHFRSDILVVVSGSSISFYDCLDFLLIYTTMNPFPGHFCVALSQTSNESFVAYPSKTGDQLIIADYHDPGYSLGAIPIPFSRIAYFQFDSKSEFIAIVVDDARSIQLWSVMELKLVAKFKRGLRSAEVNGVAFDHLSNYFMMTTRRGTMHVFSIPTEEERSKIDLTKSIRSTFSFESPKGSDFQYQFDNAGYIISGISNIGVFKQLQLDIEKGAIEQIGEEISII